MVVLTVSGEDKVTRALPDVLTAGVAIATLAATTAGVITWSCRTAGAGTVTLTVIVPGVAAAPAGPPGRAGCWWRPGPRG